jgi:predicted Rossmann-fold nucleotide-binding protein
MGALNEVGHTLGSKVIGCIHRMWVVDGQDYGLANMRVADGRGLHERKQLLFEEADGFICLPGGMGTYDEVCFSYLGIPATTTPPAEEQINVFFLQLWEVACEHQLGLRQEPVILVNTDGFYDGFIQQVRPANTVFNFYCNCRNFLEQFKQRRCKSDFILFV